jgi:hypothetical protein
MAPENGRRFFLGDAGAFGPQEGMTVKNLGAVVRTMPWRIAAALVVACLLAVGGWVFAQDKPTVPAAPVQTAAVAPPPSKPDPTGTATGGIADVTAKTPGKPTLEEIADFAGHNRVSLNVMWTLLAGFLVMFMQAGFALAETGFTRAKNVAHTMMMNFMVYAIGMTGYWICGFALQMGGLGGLVADGTYGDGLNGVEGTVRGLFYGGASQFVAQTIGTVTCFVFIFAASWAFFKVYDVVFGMRVSPEVELEGLDVPEMGVHGYPEIQGPATLVRAIGASTPKTPAMSMAPERVR